MEHADFDLGGDLVTQAGRLIRAVRRRHDLPAGTRVLSVLDELGPLTTTQLAAAYSCSQPTMTGLVKDLLERGWATKEPHPADSRAALVAPTAAGAAELARVRRRNGEEIAARLAADRELDVEDLRAAVRFLRRLLITEDQLSTS